MQNNYYITTPIYYVNDVPHIGHAYTSIISDIIARFMRLNKGKVLFLTGTDEHGQKVEKSAIAKSIDCQSFTDQTSQAFRQLMRVINISNDDFIRTTEARHKKAVEHFWQKLRQNGHIYQGRYEGWYSVRDEAFYDQSELLPSGLAPTGAPVEWVQEPSYFFNLSQWQDKLVEFYANNPNFIRPKSRYNEVVSFVKGGLHDLSISRTSFNWGIKVPSDEKHVIYVWLDALINYISALGYPDTGNKYQEFWPANVHIVGKDILRFHAVYWPAFLMAAGLELPKCIMAHGWWTNAGQKISKSLGNVIDPFQLVEQFGTDQVRYFLAREVTFGADGNYSRDSLINRVNSELANKIGNLIQRTMSFVHKNNHGKVPLVDANFINLAYQLPLLTKATMVHADNINLIKSFDINNILNNIISLTDEANIFIDREAPWQLKKDNQTKMLEVLYILIETLRYIAIMLQPFTPDAASKMLDQLGVANHQRNFACLTKDYALTPGKNISQPTPIFPRIII